MSTAFMVSMTMAVALVGQAPRLVDMMVAQIDSSVITLSELVAETRLLLLRTRGPELARVAELDPSLLNAVLRTMVSRELLLSEVRRLQLRDVAEIEIERAVETLRSKFLTQADYERFLERSGFGPTGTSLAAILRAELQVERFLEVRVKRAVLITEREVSRCYEVNKERYEGRPLREVNPIVRAQLTAEREQQALRSLLKQLEKRALIRYADDVQTFERSDGADDSAETFLCPEERAL